MVVSLKANRRRMLVLLGLIALPCCISARKKEGCRRRALAGILFAGTSMLQHVLLLMMLYVI